MLASLCHFEIGVGMEALLDEVDMGRLALTCHFSLDILCDKTPPLPVVNDHAFVRNWRAGRWYFRLLSRGNRPDQDRTILSLCS